MKARHIFTTIAAALVLAGIPACSNNEDPNLIPSATPTTLSAEEDGVSLQRLNLDAGTHKVPITVKSNTRWTVECTEGGWCSLSAVNGMGDGSLEFSVLENLTDQPRSCNIVLYKLNAQGEKIDEGKWTIAVQQQYSDVSLSPSSVEPFAAQPTNIQDFTIKANVPWTLSVEYEQPTSPKFVNITPKEGLTAGEDGTFTGSTDASFSIRLDDNGTAAVRIAQINLQSEVGVYSVRITQQASTTTFDVSPNSTRYIAAEGGTEIFTILSQAEAGWDIITNDPEWISFSQTSGTGGSNERVPVTVTYAPNSNGRQRTSSILFKPRTEGYVPVTVEVVQSGYDLTFSGSVENGSPSVGAAGGTIAYSLDSRFDWVTSAPGWISVNPSTGNKSDDRQSLIIEIAPNATNAERSDKVIITPISTEFPGGVTLDPKKLDINPIEIPISQGINDVTFTMSPGGFDVVPLDGATYEVTVDSRFNWTLTGSDSWVTPSVTSGIGSASTQRVTVTIGRNPNNSTRYGSITLTPGTTDFGGVNLNPASLGITPVRIDFTQFGGREAAVSTPWLLDNYTQTSATVEFNFYSPFHTIVEAGLEWSKEDGSGASSMKATPANGTDATVSFELTGLDPATKYIARGYVIDSEGNRKDGQWSYPFTTAGRFPGSGDNPTPTRSR